MAEDPNVHPVWAAETKALAERLENMDYFEVLGVEKAANINDIKAQYHALQRAFHPDTFYQSPDEDLKNAVFKIAKRVAEAYVILRDANRRAQYTRDIEGAERAKKLRYSEASEQTLKKVKEEELGKTPQGRQLYTKALAAIKKGDLAGAEKDLKTCLLFEIGSEMVKAKLEEVRAQMKAQAAKTPPPKTGAKKPGP